jgi:quercetin dioxygenase-like cupin family protein
MAPGKFRASAALLFLLLFAEGPARAQDPLQTLPKNYRLVFENGYVRVIRVSYASLEKLPVHDHPAKPTVYVYLNDSGPVRFSHVEQNPFSLVRPAEKTGTFRYSPGRLEKHEVENLGHVPSEFLRVELTRLPLGYQSSPFRSPKVFDGTHSGVRTDLEKPSLKIQRVVAAAGEATEVKAIAAGALLVAFAPTAVQSIDRGGELHQMQCGEVLWIEAGQTARVTAPEKGAAGHLLRIVVGAARWGPE